LNDFKGVMTGDILYVSGKGIVSSVIKFFTGGPVSHVGVIYDTRLVFETDGAWMKAQLYPLTKYNAAKVYVRRLKSMTGAQKGCVQELCEKYNNTPYSYWDIILNAVGIVLPKKKRKKFVSVLGTKAFAKCDEMTRRIIYEATGYPPFENFEDSTPSDMFIDGEYSGDFQVII